MTFLGPLEHLKFWSHANPNYRLLAAKSPDRRGTDPEETDNAGVDTRYQFHEIRRTHDGD